MLGNRPSTTEDDLYPTALVQFGSALTSVAASAVQVTDLSNSTSTAFENSKGKNESNPVPEGAALQYNVRNTEISDILIMVSYPVYKMLQQHQKKNKKPITMNSLIT